MSRFLRIALALLGFLAAIFGAGLLVSAVFDAHRTSRLLDGVVAIGFLGASFALLSLVGLDPPRRNKLSYSSPPRSLSQKRVTGFTTPAAAYFGHPLTRSGGRGAEAS